MAVIVIVDDQASARAMIRSLVQGVHESIVVEEFWDPEQALAWCSSHAPDLVMLDYRMPSLDGITFTERLRASPAGQHTAVMMITAQGDSSIRLAALQAGVVEFVTKPIVPQEIKLRVYNLLEFAGRREPRPADVSAPASVDERGVALRALAKVVQRLREQRQACAHEVVSVEAVAGGIGRALRLDDATLAKLEAASRVYDIGMVLVPGSATDGERALADDDRAAVHRHVQLSRELLSDVDPEIAEAVYHHHEHFNGSGYPDGLIGGQIPLASRILSVADTFCSLVSKRPHRDAFRISEATNQISSKSGTTFDPDCVDALVQCLPELLGKTGSLPARFVDTLGAGVR